MSSLQGIFITFEGGEGAGKSTQIKLLSEVLQEKNLNIVMTREPGGTDQAERIRNLLVQGDSGKFEPLTEALLLFAARHEHVVHKIRPALERGEWVICDRFADSTRAMQGAGMGLAQEKIQGLYDMAVEDIVPDLTFILDIAPEIGLERSTKRVAAEKSGENRYENMELEFHRRLRQGFLDIAAAEPDRCIVIDATQSVTDMHARICEIVQARFDGQGQRHHG